MEDDREPNDWAYWVAWSVVLVLLVAADLPLWATALAAAAFGVVGRLALRRWPTSYVGPPGDGAPALPDDLRRLLALAPFVAGLVLAAGCGLLLRHACVHGGVDVPEVVRGTPRWRACRDLPAAPWLTGAAGPLAGVLVALAVARRRPRLACAVVLLAALATGVWIGHVDGLRSQVSI